MEQKLNTIFAELNQIFGKNGYALGGSLALKHPQLYAGLSEDRKIHDIDIVVFDNSCYMYETGSKWLSLFELYRINRECRSGSFYDKHGNRLKCFNIKLLSADVTIDVMTFADDYVAEQFKVHNCHYLGDKFYCSYVQKASVIMEAKQQLLDMNMLAFDTDGHPACNYQKHYKDMIDLQNKRLLDMFKNDTGKADMEILPVCLRV